MKRSLPLIVGALALSVLALSGCTELSEEFGGGPSDAGGATAEPSPAPPSPPSPPSVHDSVPEGSYPKDVKEAKIRTSDGRIVTCLYMYGYAEYTLSCDWEGAVPAEAQPSDGG